jgi:IS5 family transposase
LTHLSIRPLLNHQQKGKKAKDSDVAWGAKGKGKNKKYCYEYKVHVGVDQGSGIVQKTGITNARVNDHEVFDELISGNEQGMYADKAYYDKERAEELETRGMENRLMKRWARGTPLSNLIRPGTRAFPRSGLR